jgi:hypothetical protein
MGSGGSMGSAACLMSLDLLASNRSAPTSLASAGALTHCTRNLSLQSVWWVVVWVGGWVGGGCGVCVCVWGGGYCVAVSCVFGCARACVAAAPGAPGSGSCRQTQAAGYGAPPVRRRAVGWVYEWGGCCCATAPRTCEVGGVLALLLHDDLHLLAGVGVHETVAGAHAVLLGAGRLDLERDLVAGGVLQRQCDGDVLLELEPARDRGARPRHGRPRLVLQPGRGARRRAPTPHLT